MTFQNIKLSRVMVAVVSIWGLALVLSFVISFITAPFMPSDMGDRALDYLDVFSDADATPEDIEEVRNSFWDDFGAQLTVQYVLQWTVIALVIFWLTGRVARKADSPEQATGYGVMIAIGAAASYGILCACVPAVVLGSSTLVAIVFVFLGLFIAAGYIGGRSAGQNLQPQTAGGPAGGGMPGFGGTPPRGTVSRGTGGAAPASATDVQMYYNMGVQAALGGRREEARQHFTRVLQMQPRNVAAWLQLANLADTPDQAWNYVQQARSINPTDPAVLEAVDIIWPQVAANAEKRQPPRNQPPYPGGQQDDVAVPRLHLPGSALDADQTGYGPQTDAESGALSGDVDLSNGEQDSDAPPPPPPGPGVG